MCYSELVLHYYFYYYCCCCWNSPHNSFSEWNFYPFSQFLCVTNSFSNFYATKLYNKQYITLHTHTHTYTQCAIIIFFFFYMQSFIQFYKSMFPCLFDVHTYIFWLYTYNTIWNILWLSNARQKFTGGKNKSTYSPDLANFVFSFIILIMYITSPSTGVQLAAMLCSFLFLFFYYWDVICVNFLSWQTYRPFVR